MRISFCIPCYECYGNSKRYLFDIFYALKNQEVQNFNVWISDHSQNNDVLEACQEYADLFEINYIKNENGRGNNSININNVLKYADGEILKIHFQDDFILTQNLTKELDERFVNGVEWLVTGFAHTIDDGKTHYNPKIPVWNPNLLQGVNTLSSPSILAIKNGINEYFDENLIMLMDCDMYYRLYKYHGNPEILENFHISNREHRNQLQRSSEYLLPKEINYLKEKYKI